MRVECVAVGDLRLDPRNARVHDARSLDAIARSLERFGQQKPIVADAAGKVLAGNGTLEAARRLGWTHVDVVRTALDGREATAYGLADNRTSDLSAFDPATLADLLAEVGGEKVVPGFESIEDVEALEIEGSNEWEAMHASDPLTRTSGMVYLALEVPEVEAFEAAVAEAAQDNERPIETILRVLRRP